MRATCITVLSDSGFEARHIVTISGHRNEQSVQNYVRDTSTAQKRDMSASISSYTAANSTANLDQNNNNENINNSVFDVNESDLTEDQCDNIFESIQQGEAELHPLSDLTNINPPAQTTKCTGMNKHPKKRQGFHKEIHREVEQALQFDNEGVAIDSEPSQRQTQAPEPPEGLGDAL